jgi:pyruvate kinase
VFFFVGHLRLLHEVFLVSLLFLQGPEIRTGFLKDGKPIKLTKGQEITVTTDYDIKGDENMIAMSYKKLPVDVKPGNVILCADGTISLAVLSCDPGAGTVRCRCENTAMLGERKNCNLPGIVVDLPTLTEKDKEDILGWGVPNDIDMIALSFVRKGSDLVTVRQVLGQHAKRIKLMSKVRIYYHCRPLKGYISYISVHNLARLHFLFASLE